jgi:hypothetical protein
MTRLATTPATARDIILEVVRNMNEGLEPLHETILPPAVYRVYLHRGDLDRISSIASRIIDETRRALKAEIAKINRATLGQKLGIKRAAATVEMPSADWTIELLENTEEETQPGDIVVYSELALPAKPEYSGSLTRRIATRRFSGDAPASRPDREPARTDSPAFATLQYEDNHGSQTYRMTKNQIVIGRGGTDYWTDLTLHTAPDVSREHLRLRRDPTTGKFFLKDMSRLGTTIDGRKTPTSVEEIDGHLKDKNIEVSLPNRARIGLADVVFIDFEGGSAK